MAPIFVKKGIQPGRRKDLTGGGLLRSAGGWLNLNALREEKIFYKEFIANFQALVRCLSQI